jgi:hypothetical protein
MCKYWLYDYEQNGRSKLFNLDFGWVTLEYGLFFLNCYEWCKFPFTKWSVDIILSKEPVLFFFFIHGNFILSDAKSVSIRDKKKLYNANCLEIGCIYSILSIAWVHNYNPNLVICTPLFWNMPPKSNCQWVQAF